VTGLVLLALAWVGIWLVPPWWTPYALAAIWVISAIRALARPGRSRPFWPYHGRQWASVAVLSLLGGLAVLLGASAYAGRTPSSEVVELAFPLQGGPFFVISGGSTKAVNMHIHALTFATEPMSAYRGQRFAVDIVKLDAFGLRAQGLRPRDPAAYHIFGEALYAPCNGIVLHAEDGHSDRYVPETDREHMPGNHVILDCGNAIVLMAHMAHGSVKVREGDTIRTGDSIGAVGNSGNTEEPHLHIHAQRPGTRNAPLSGEPVQIRMGGRFLVRNDRFTTR
jgi:murein DD-endopeptidase MepM/ murein hydrolase activator NlpD